MKKLSNWLVLIIIGATIYFTIAAYPKVRAKVKSIYSSVIGRGKDHKK